MNPRDIEFISSYLDGQLSPSESARLESRLSADREFASAFNDIRFARGMLHKLPLRRAPRNFTLTRKMVGLNPPLPRSYTLFRFSTALASILLLLTFAANAIIPRVSFSASAPLAGNYGLGGGYGGGAPPSINMQPPAEESIPAPTEAPAAAAEAPASGASILPSSTPFSATADGSRTGDVSPSPEAPVNKDAATAPAPQDQTQIEKEPVVSSIWQIGFLVIIIIGGLSTFLMRRYAARKWM